MIPQTRRQFGQNLGLAATCGLVMSIRRCLGQVPTPDIGFWHNQNPWARVLGFLGAFFVAQHVETTWILSIQMNVQLRNKTT